LRSHRSFLRRRYCAVYDMKISFANTFNDYLQG
jgi:hypothetical protein